MAKAVFATVDDYIAAQPAPAQAALKRVRAAILEAVPGAAEGISYNMPAYKLGKTRLLQFAAWSDHYALYVSTAQIAAAFESELRNCEIDTGTIRFPLDEPVPEHLIGRIAKMRADVT